MEDVPNYMPIVSVKLSCALDQIGLSKMTVTRRRHAMLYAENVLTAGISICENDRTIYHFGSQSEGTTTLGLDSDLDTLMCLNDHVVIQDWEKWQRGKHNYLMLREDTAPGYCRLQLLRSDEPLPEHILDNGSMYDNHKRVIVKNSIFHSLVVKDKSKEFQIKSGPAMTRERQQGYKDADVVVAYKCDGWPRQADEWARRPRRRQRGHWPIQDLIHNVVSSETFIVPVGYKLSPTEELEWRISTSEAERLLMFSMNMTQLKCYVVLKMIIKSFVTPAVGKSITSYHCKTALFHCMEETASAFWQEKYLVPCVNQCLNMLLLWVMNGHCPNYFIPDSNLFAGKIGARNRSQLESILKDLIASNGRFLLMIKIDGIGQRLCNNLANADVRTLYPPLVSCRIELDRHYAFSDITRSIMVKRVSLQPRNLILSVTNDIRKLRDIIGRANRIKLTAVHSIIQFFYCWLGFLFMSVSLSKQKGITKQALRCIKMGSKTDMEFRLKLASAFYCNGDMQKAERILQNAEKCFLRDRILSRCRCSQKHIEAPFGEFPLRVHGTNSQKKRNGLITDCVKFSPHEIQCAPQGMRHELLHRSTADDFRLRDSKYDSWMVLAAVDCQPFMYYLQYITYKHTGKDDLKTPALRKLEHCVREEQGFSHLETAWNLLGQCQELENKQDAAVRCYRASLGVKPRNNAAKWHLMRLNRR